MIFFDRKWIWLQELEKLSLYTDVRIELGTIENCRTIPRCEDIELYRSSINEITLIIEIKRKINKENKKNKPISYPRTETVTRESPLNFLSAESCAISGNLTGRALYTNTVDRGQSFQFLTAGYMGYRRRLLSPRMGSRYNRSKAVH